MPKRLNDENIIARENKRVRLSMDEKKNVLLLLDEIPTLGLRKAARIISEKLNKKIGTFIMNNVVLDNDSKF